MNPITLTSQSSQVCPSTLVTPSPQKKEEEEEEGEGGEGEGGEGRRGCPPNPQGPHHTSSPASIASLTFPSKLQARTHFQSPPRSPPGT